MATKRINQTFIRKCLERRANDLIYRLYAEIPVPPEVIEAKIKREEADKIYEEVRKIENEWYNRLRKMKDDIRQKVNTQVAIMEESIILGADNEEAKALLQQFDAWEPQ